MKSNTPTQRNRKLKLFFALATAMLLSLFLSPAAQAASATWNGNTDATWADTTGNWSNTPGVVPGTTDTATFDNAGGAVDIIDLGGGVTINTILFDLASAAAYRSVRAGSGARR